MGKVFALVMVDVLFAALATATVASGLTEWWMTATVVIFYVAAIVFGTRAAVEWPRARRARIQHHSQR